jgi:putative ABC transport system substrate-binding protein
LFATTSDAIEYGALAALSIDFTALGHESARLALTVLEQGINPGSIPIKIAADPKIILNEERARALGVDLANVKSRWPDIDVRSK